MLKFKKPVKLQDTIKKYSLPNVFLRDIDEGYLSLEDAHNKQSKFATKKKIFFK